MKPWGVDVFNRNRGCEKEEWSFSAITVRVPRLVKRYPRPVRIPRETPTLLCHCRIGKLEVQGEEVICQRCGNPISTESFPNRIRRAIKLWKRADLRSKKIPLTRGLFALVDREDYEKFSKHLWHVSNKYGYAVRNDSKKHGKKIYMHVEILRRMEFRNFDEGDHKNENKLDNRRENLRPCTHSQNKMNVSLTEVNTSGSKGVYRRESGKWAAQIWKGGRPRWLGVFDSRIEAEKVYDKAARKYHGDFSKTNLDIRKARSSSGQEISSGERVGGSHKRPTSRRRKRNAVRSKKSSARRRVRISAKGRTGNKKVARSSRKEKPRDGEVLGPTIPSGEVVSTQAISPTPEKEEVGIGKSISA